MIKINRLRTEILSDKSSSIEELYGFDYEFKNGLNIVAGHNSRGKTTINSCIYYALGMEELLGGHNEKALDKALKDEFTIKSAQDEGINHKVMYSKVILEIESNGEIATLRRNIITDNPERKSNIINVTNSNIDNSSFSIESSDYFVNGRGNNDTNNGFYAWLSKFGNIEIPMVSNTSKVDNYSPLYLQVIFSTLFIEQTKGWSDFFATMPNFGITNAKQKNVEFLLNLNELILSTQRDILLKEKNDFIEDWKNTIKSLEQVSKQHNGFFYGLPNELTTEKFVIDKINISFSISEDENITLNKFLEKKKSQYSLLENMPISTIKNNREEVLVKYSETKNEYRKLKEYINNFEDKLAIEAYQLINLKKQLIRVTQEIKDQFSLNKVYSQNIINKIGTHCPTCTQLVSTDLISSQSIKIEKLSIDETIAFLKGQKNLIETSLNSLESTITEKKLLFEYFNENLRQKESLIKSLSRDLIADDRAFSESDVLRKIQLEKEIENLLFVGQRIMELKNELVVISNKYYDNKIELNKLKKSENEDENTLIKFENKYKELLYSFGYESNEKSQ